MFVIKLEQDPYFFSSLYKSEASAKKDLESMKKLWIRQGYFKSSLGERILIPDLKFSIAPME